MNSENKKLLKSAIPSLVLLVLLWGIHFFNIHYNLSLYKFGIFPRNLNGLQGVLFSPLIHSSDDIKHIVNNSVPLLILGWTLFFFYKKIAFRILSYSWIVVGLLVWISARESFHIGMSGVIYCLAFFLFFSGVFRKEKRLMAISLFVVFLYGSMIWGIFPFDLSISFESHFFGALTGVILAFFYKKEGASFKRKKTQWEIEEEMGIEPPDYENNIYF
ncbi:MAG: rhomboid family intramembrane serine protease [Flavobacteriales bacterium]|jgi:membrane associated rhomboid family serine protease|nr:rhomboid family intramembrane serine protease [Flavobacteriales bacterium]